MIASQAKLSKLYTKPLPHTKATRDSALNVCKTKVKIKHKPDREEFKENEADDGMQESFPRFLTVKNFNLTERESLTVSPLWPVSF